MERLLLNFSNASLPLNLADDANAATRDLFEPDRTVPEGCIELKSVKFGMQQRRDTDVSNRSRTTGRPELQDITCVKRIDHTSTDLYRHCLSSRPLGPEDAKTMLHILSGPDSKNPSAARAVMTIELGNVLVTSIETQSQPKESPTEEFTLNFTDIKWVYKSSVDSEKGDKQDVFGWDMGRNRPMS